MEVVLQNDDKTVRVARYFNDRQGAWCYYLEKWHPPIKFLFWTFKGRWHDGGHRGKAYIPPVRTYNLEVVRHWAEHYELKGDEVWKV